MAMAVSAWPYFMASELKSIKPDTRMNGIFKASSGSPITINSSSAGWSETVNTNRLERPDLAPGATNNPVHGVSRGCTGGPPAGIKLGTPDLWLDPCAFTVSALGFLGNLGRNTVSGPNRVALDYSLMKNTGIPSIQSNSEFSSAPNSSTLQTIRTSDCRACVWLITVEITIAVRA